MALAEAEIGTQPDVPGITRPMTYEEYISGPEEMARYDILDGWKVYRLYGDKLLPSPTRQHQNIALNLAESFRRFQRANRQGQVIIAPCDVEVTYQPLRSRQPDLLFISRERLAQNAPSDEYAPLSPAPELVVEIVSPSDTASVLAAKMADYLSCGSAGTLAGALRGTDGGSGDTGRRRKPRFRARRNGSFPRV